MIGLVVKAFYFSAVDLLGLHAFAHLHTAGLGLGLLAVDALLKVERVVLAVGLFYGHVRDLLVGLRVLTGQALEGRRATAELAPRADRVDDLVELFEVFIVVIVELGVLAVVGRGDLVVGVDLVVLG